MSTKHSLTHNFHIETINNSKSRPIHFTGALTTRTVFGIPFHSSNHLFFGRLRSLLIPILVQYGHIRGIVY